MLRYNMKAGTLSTDDSVSVRTSEILTALQMCGVCYRYTQPRGRTFDPYVIDVLDIAPSGSTIICTESIRARVYCREAFVVVLLSICVGLLPDYWKHEA